MNIQKIPIFLLTGFLGSGKTTLLKEWLKSELLKNAALIINELGEVGLDQHLLANASESTALLPNACVCCTGLPALNEALEQLFWARLERRMPRFPNLVIETTGMASPGPILQSLDQSDLVKERYECMGTIACLSATTAQEVLNQHQEARAQLIACDVCILTKADLVNERDLQWLRLSLEEMFAQANQPKPILISRSGDLPVQSMLKTLHLAKDQRSHQGMDASCQVCLDACASHDSNHAHEHEHTHKPTQATNQSTHHGHPHTAHHHANAYFWAMPNSLKPDTWKSQIDQARELFGHALLRIKGRIQDHTGLWIVQLAPFEKNISIVAEEHSPSLNSTNLPALGLTLIVAEPLDSSQRDWLVEHVNLAG